MSMLPFKIFPEGQTNTRVRLANGKEMVFEGVGYIKFLTRKLEVDQMGDRRPLAQHCYPFLSADQREFLMSGMTPDEFNSL